MILQLTTHRPDHRTGNSSGLTHRSGDINRAPKTPLTAFTALLYLIGIFCVKPPYPIVTGSTGSQLLEGVIFDLTVKGTCDQLASMIDNFLCIAKKWRTRVRYIRSFKGLFGALCAEYHSRTVFDVCNFSVCPSFNGKLLCIKYI